MNMQKIIERYRQMRKYAVLSKKYAHSYAFVGLGNHALQNLYPVLDYLHVPLKYIVTRSAKSAEMAAKLYRGCECTTDFDKVLSDTCVKGVFICASPSSHFELIRRVLAAGKHVFAEKPPCTSLEALNALITAKNNHRAEVFVGLQRRYSPAFSMLKHNVKNVSHYLYRYATGAYPEGDALLELFIHPVDAVNFLFGKAEIISCLRRKNTCLLNVRHENGIIGNIELSTDYSWKEPIEFLSVNAESGIFILNGMDSLVYTKKPKTIAQIPLEKITKYTPRHTVLFSRNTFTPHLQNNDLFVHGFYGELKSFVEFCETENGKLNKSGLSSLSNTFSLLEQLVRYG